MRDLVLIFGFLGLLPLCFLRPQIGILVWTWFAVMNPHRETFGLAYDIPFNQLIVIATFGGWLLSADAKKLPMNWTVAALIAFGAWTLVTTLTALDFASAWVYFMHIPIKVFVYLIAVLLIVNTRTRLVALMWVLAISIGYYCARNGVAGILAGGRNLGTADFGPQGSMIGDRNHLSLAMVMVMPILYYLARYSRTQWVRIVIYGVIALGVLAVLTSYSRGGFIALVAMGGFLWLKTRQKLLTAAILLVLAIPAYNFVPDEWKERMESIETMKEDKSFAGRLHAWNMAINIANQRPLVGGGFTATQQPGISARFGEGRYDPKAAHSIYFQVLGDHGYVGLALYLLLMYLGWRQAVWVIRQTRDRIDLLWAQDFARTMQVAMVGFAVGGAALSMAYYDGYLVLIVMTVILRNIVAKEVGAEAAPGARRFARGKPAGVAGPHPAE